MGISSMSTIVSNDINGKRPGKSAVLKSMFIGIAGSFLKDASHFTKFRDLLKDAYLVSQFASETGVEVKPLHDAIALAEAEVSKGSLSHPTAQALLSAQGEAIKALKVANIRVIKSWFSPWNIFFCWLNRIAVFVLVCACLIVVVLFTFVYSDSISRVKNIAAFCEDKTVTVLPVSGEKSAPPSILTVASKPEDSLKTCLNLREGTGVRGDPAGHQVATDHVSLVEDTARITRIAQDAITIKTYTSPSTGLLLLDAIAYKINRIMEPKLQRGVISTPTEKEELAKALLETPGSVLYSAAQDYSFVLYVLGSGILPMVYGVLGSSVFIMRRIMSTDANDYMLISSPSQVFMRIGLGGVAGIIIGWFNIPNANGITTLASTQFILAFLAGFSIDILFSFLDKLLSIFEAKR
jgi:hypothetical protein